MTGRLTGMLAAAAAAFALTSGASAQVGGDCDPAYGCDTKAPKVKLSLTGKKLRSLASTGKLAARVKVDEAARVTLSATGKAGSVKLSFKGAKLTFDDTGSKTATFRLSSSSQKALKRYARKRGAKARVTISGTATDDFRNKRKLKFAETLS